MLSSGDKIGEYILLNKVGSGGFSDVWKAEKRTAIDVNHFALKFFRPKDKHLDFKKIVKELAVWKQLKGLPHIISVIELDRIDDYVYVVSDFADGGSLEKWIKNKRGKPTSEEKAVKIALEILTGLESLHEKGFVHRDLKPDNILLMNGKFCLADFGVSHKIKTYSKATGTAGTLEYMPPEAFARNPSVTAETDIWAIGTILQKLLTGSLPYPQEDQSSLIKAILFDEPEPMPETVTAGLREIVKKALQKNRENRFQTASEMREALNNPQRFLEEIKSKIAPKSTIIDIYAEEVKKEKPAKTDNKIEISENKTGVESDAFEQYLKQFSKDEKKIPRFMRLLLGITGFVCLVVIAGIFFTQNQYVNYTSQTDNKTKELPLNLFTNKPNNTVRNQPANNPPNKPANTLANKSVGSASNVANPPKKNVNANVGNSVVIEKDEDPPKTAIYYFDIAFNCPSGDYNCKITNYSKAIELNPSDPLAYNNRGVAYEFKGNYEQAIADYRKAIMLKPNFKEAKDNLNELLERRHLP